MSDVTTAAEQDAIADSLVAEPEPSSLAQQQPETETQEAEVEQQPVEQTQEQTEEQPDDWLPSEQEKVFPTEVLARYAQRYGFDEGRLSDPLIQRVLADKINSDIFIQQIRQQQEQAFEQETESQTQDQSQAQLTPEQHFTQLQSYAEQKTNPEAAKWFHTNFLKAFGISDADISRVPQEQAIRFGQVATAGIANVLNTVLPDLLQSQLSPLLEQAFPQFGEMYERSSNAMAWDQVRNSDPRYAALPAYGTKDFSKKMHEAAARIPGFDDLLPAKPTFNQARQFYSMLAHFATGGNVDNSLLQQAAAAGANNARRAAVRRSAGALGSGQSKGASGGSTSSRYQTNTDIFNDETDAIWQREHGRI